ncbi:MAG: methylated-DNA--[protein]-cysteine S-methyltransferase [Desulfomonilaceae bacterium]
MAHPKEEICYYFHDKVGWLRLHATDKGVSELTFVPQPDSDHAQPSSPVMKQLIRELDAYFSGAPLRFLTPVDVSWGSPFCRDVWSALQTVPYGKTISYGGLAAMIGKPGAARAVGLAVGKNPAPIIIPCHRVIRSDGSLGGYGPGVALKQSLLDLEHSAQETAMDAMKAQRKS